MKKDEMTCLLLGGALGVVAFPVMWFAIKYICTALFAVSYIVRGF